MLRATITLVTAFIVVALIVSTSCDESEPDTPVNGNSDQYGPLPETVDGWNVSRGAAPGYVSDAACKTCHEAIYDSYQAMGMARSFYRLEPDTVVEDLGKTYYHELTGRYYEMFERDGKYYQRRYCKDKQGRHYAEYEAEVAWVIGSGNHVRSYLSQTGHGELYQLPLSWYADGGWKMSPGYDRKEHHGFERRIQRPCMFCHNAYPEAPFGSDLQHKPHVFPKELPKGIGCQRCHGPGARHVEAATAENSSDEEIRKRILNPAHFTPQQLDDLCMTCHLQPEAIANSDLMPRSFKRPMYSQLPGEPLTDYITYIDHGPEKERRERIQVNGHAYRMRWSRCHSESKGKMTCTTCHDPHRKVPPKEQAAFYRQKCFQCHELSDCQMEEMGSTRDPASSDCVSCHMVKARPVDVIHVKITDHFIRRHPPTKDLTAPRKEHETKTHALSVVPYFPKRSGKDPLWKLHAGFGAMNSPTPEAMNRWRQAFEQTRPHAVAAYVEIGRSLLESGGHRHAIELLTEGAQRFPKVAAVHWTLGDALLGSGQPAAALPHLEKAHELDKTHPGINRSLGDTYSMTGPLKKARSAYEQSLKVRPAAWLSWRNYALTLAKLGDTDATLDALQHAIALNPDDADACYSMSALYEAQGRHAEMFRVLEQGATNLLDVKLRLVVAYLVSDNSKFRDSAKAMTHATEAVKEHGGNPRSHLHLALAMLLSGAPDPTSLAKTIDTARTKGADPACCHALTLLDSMRRKDRAKAAEASAQLDRALKDPSNEPLRGLLVHMVQFEIRKQNQKK